MFEDTIYEFRGDPSDIGLCGRRHFRNSSMNVRGEDKEIHMASPSLFYVGTTGLAAPLRLSE